MRKGFTLIELMIVIAIIAIIAAIAIPNLLDSKISANESAASSSLKSGVHSSQVTFQASKSNNLDADNNGEFGHLGHLSGAVQCWGNDGTGTAAGEFDLLEDDFDTDDPARLVSADTSTDISGYIFASYLDVDTTAAGANSVVSAANINNAERYFCAVAVPDAFGDTGRNAFIINQRGTVYASPEASNIYEGNTDRAITSAVGCYDTLASAVQNGNDDDASRAW